MEIDESWGKVGCFLLFFAIFEKGQSQKRFTLEVGNILLRYSMAMSYADYC